MTDRDTGVRAGDAAAVAIIVAAGRGVRLGTATPKQFLEVAGKPLLAHTLSSFARCRVIMRSVLVLPREGFSGASSMMEPFVREVGETHGVELTPGGDSRQASVRAGIERLSGADGRNPLIAVHDGARPLVTPGLIERVVAAARARGGAIAAVPVVETLKRVSPDGIVVETVERERYFRAQTPQCFPLSVLRRAFDRAEADKFTGTDEAALVERIGEPVAIVPGDEANFKVTHPDDLARVDLLLAQREREQEQAK